MSSVWIRLAGRVPATDIAAHSAPTWETLADGGIGDISFALSLRPRAHHGLLKAGTRVEVMYGATPVAAGLMTEPDRTTWEIQAHGHSSAVRSLLSLDSLFQPTWDVAVALTGVLHHGWLDATDPRGEVVGYMVGTDLAPMMFGDVLDSVAAYHGKRWGIDAHRHFYMRGDPVVPRFVLAPGSAAFGTTDEDQVTEVYATYLNADLGGAESSYLYRTYRQHVRHEIVDLKGRGEMTEAQVVQLLTGAMTLGKAETRWTNGVEVAPEQIMRNGTPAFLPNVIAGQMARVTGLQSAEGVQAPWHDVVIGKTRYTAGARTIYLEPVNTAPRTLADIIAAA